MIVSRAVEQYAPQWGVGDVHCVAFHDTSHGADDERYTAIYQYVDGSRFALHAAKNDFTTAQRVEGWAQLEEHYNALGIYAPRTLPNTAGELATLVDGYVCYAEEFMIASVPEKVTMYAPEDWRKQPYGADALSTIGLLASNPAPYVPWATCWCLYEKFSPSDPCDERLENAISLSVWFARNMPRYADRAADILQKYQAIRAAFLPVYRTLPKAVWQGDLANFIIDEKANFAGVFDFNLSGSDVILNYLFSETRSTLNDLGNRKADTILDQAERDTHDERMAMFLALACTHYRLTDAEKRAWGCYYQIAYPFFQQNLSFIMKNLTEYGELYADILLTWIEQQMERKNVDMLLP